MIDLTNSTKLSADCIITDLEDSKKIIDMLKDLGVTVNTIYVNRIDRED